MGLALLAWCCLVAAAEAASSDALGFRFASFPPRSRDSLVLSGAASLVPPLVVLTSNITGQAGVAWNQHRVWADEFVCNFTFSVDADLGEGGDGVALVFFGAPGARPTGHSVAEQAGGLGYGSGLDEPGEEIPFSVAIEFDTHYDETLADPSQQHVALHSLGSSPNSANESVARIGPLGLANVPPSMRRSPQTVLVTYRQQQLTVTLSSFQAPALQVAVDLLGMTGTAGGDGLFVGISASTGTSSRDRHVLRQWSFAYTGDTLSPKNSRVYGSGWTALQVTAGQQQSFFIDARDLYNHSFAGSPNVFYALIGEISVPAVQSESDASLYKVVFEGAKAGQLVLQVLTFDDVLVATSHTVCVPGPLDPDASQLGGDWRGGTVGRSYVFTVTMTDGYGNRVEPGRTVALAVDFSPSGPEADQQPCGNCKVSDDAYFVSFCLCGHVGTGSVFVCDGELFAGHVWHDCACGRRGGAGISLCRVLLGRPGGSRESHRRRLGSCRRSRGQSRELCGAVAGPVFQPRLLPCQCVCRRVWKWSDFGSLGVAAVARAIRRLLDHQSCRLLLLCGASKRRGYHRVPCRNGACVASLRRFCFFFLFAAS